MAWQASLDIDYRLAAAEADDSGARRTVGQGRHSGPLRILRSLYPEGPSVCHHVIVHPPGGVAGGDVLALSTRLAEGSHALLTTPGATRFYRSSGETAQQSLDARVGAHARLEWLPLETLVHDGARARNRLAFALADGAQTIGWDVLALGLAASDRPFERGRFEQSIELSGGGGIGGGMGGGIGDGIGDGNRAGADAWLERCVLDFDEPHAPRTRRLLASPLGWGGCTVLATVWFASGSPLDEPQRADLLEAARALRVPAGARCGATSPSPRLVVLRMLGARVEPLMQHALAVRAAWRRAAWQLGDCVPRVWRT